MTRYLLFALTAAFACAEPLEAILARMDASAGGTSTFSANLTSDDYTKALKDHDEQSGTIRMKRTKNRLLVRMDIEKPRVHLYYFAGDALEHYIPTAKAVEVWQVSKVVKSADQYSSLVFGLIGMTGAELRKAYTVTAGAEESIGKVQTTRLELIPKDKKILEEFPKLELWIAVGQIYAMQQKVTAKSGNYRLYTYSDPKLNSNLPDSSFKFTVPAGTARRLMN